MKTERSHEQARLGANHVEIVKERQGEEADR